MKYLALLALLPCSPAFASPPRVGDLVPLERSQITCAIDRKIIEPCPGCYPIPAGDEVPSGAGMISVRANILGIDQFVAQAPSCPEFLARIDAQKPLVAQIDRIAERVTVSDFFLRTVGLRIGGTIVGGFVHKRGSPARD